MNYFQIRQKAIAFTESGSTAKTAIGTEDMMWKRERNDNKSHPDNLLRISEIIRIFFSRINHSKQRKRWYNKNGE
jgi:hypothetical protein